MIRKIESELVRYVELKFRQLKEYYEIPKGDLIFAGRLKIEIKAFGSTVYKRNRNDEYDEFVKRGIGFSLSTKTPYALKFSGSCSEITMCYFIAYLNRDFKRIERLFFPDGIIEPNPRLLEVVRYFRFCFGLKRSDFSKFLKQLTLINIMSV